MARKKVTRREFVSSTGKLGLGAMIVPRHVLGAGFQAPSDTVNVAVVGYVHGMGTSNLMAVAKSDNIVALCDCDTSEAAKAALVRHSAPPIRAAIRRAVSASGRA